ncbi:unnamed protein product [Fructobacillus fructosus]|uniref:DUF2786 domain-containing protein n=1 Tax=Fructobacillus fructosus TaxID=1631 RepID=A0ABM9MWW3_9LACO|nr:unnamed protein product [Fructobacillus fructosus]CAK1246008.1 unnamed protein product [Fructobacillus fructosus]
MGNLKLELTVNDRKSITRLLFLLKQRNIDKEDTVKRAKKILLKHRVKESNVYVSRVLEDFECHLGIYPIIRDEYPRYDYRFADKVITYAEGLIHFYKIFQLLLSKENNEAIRHTFLYTIYLRWIYFDNEKIEIREIDRDDWNYILMLAIAGSEMYIEVSLNIGAAYFSRLYKVDDEDYSVSKYGTREDRNRLANKYRKKYFSQKNGG